jgi:hypothetical protein
MPSLSESTIGVASMAHSCNQDEVPLREETQNDAVMVAKE